MPADYELKLAVQKIGDKRLNFNLFKGEKESQVLITPMPATARQTKSVEAELGEVKRLAKGVCFWENQQLVFATKAAPAPTWEGLITKIFKARSCSSFLPVVVRQLGAAETDEVNVSDGEASDAGGPPAPPPAADLQATWLSLKAALIPQIKPVLAGNSPRKAQLTALVQGALAAEKSGAFAEAIAAFEKARPLLGTVPATAVASASAAPAGVVPPPPPPTPPKSVSPRTAAELTAAVNQLAPEIKAAAGDATRRPEILRAVGEFQQAMKAGNLAAATQALEALTGMVRPAATPSSSPTPTPTQAPGEGTATPQPVAPVDGAVLLTRWREAKEAADEQINVLRASLLKTGQPKLMKIAAQGITAGGLGALTNGLLTPLWAALLEGSRGALAEPQRAKIAQTAGALRQFLSGDARLGLCEKNPVTGPLPIRAPLLAALEEITRAVA